MKRLIIALLLLAMTAGTAFAHGGFPDPLEGPIAYEDCPAAVRATAWPGMILIVPGVLIGTIGGLIAAPFQGDTWTVSAGAYGGALAGNIFGTTITGAPAFIFYRLFSGHGCGGGEI